jgi:glycosyltransferase involved in cell wall biosynthesis
MESFLQWNKLTKIESEIMRNVLNGSKDFLYSTMLIYFDSPCLRILLIKDPTISFQWFHLIKKTDIIICGNSYYRSKDRLLKDFLIFKLFDFPLENIYFYCSSQDVVQTAFEIGFPRVYFLNHNCFLDEKQFELQKDFKKIYNSVLIGRTSAYKRLMLAKKVKNLALVLGSNFKNDKLFSDIPPHIYQNEKRLSSIEVREIIQQSYSGLCLSEEEGVCYASSEYLLCGIPVISTPSRGGRNIWYNQKNSIICQPDPNAIAESVEFFIKNPPNPMTIRNEHIRKSKEHRKVFICMLQSIFDRFNIKENALLFFERNFFHKMEKFYKHEVIIQMLEENNIKNKNV